MREHHQAFEVPMAELSAEAIEGVVDAFVQREGTDHGEQEQEVAQQAKRTQIIAQLLNGEVAIMFDPATTTCNLVPRRQTGAATSISTPREARQ
jgi:uncharacterized protein YheU (UPF0270 family)